ncbi:MAG: energy transducer TonB [Chthoniobacterales bacterium]
MSKNSFLRLAGTLLLLGTAPLAMAANHPAMIGQGAGSVAMQLHYPPREKVAKKEGIVQFYCEVGPEGKAGHISTLYGKGQSRFGSAVEHALYHGRFDPAMVDGKPATVMLGGTVLFVESGGHPTIAVSLATVESDKVATMSNYVQPQMIDSDALFRRKIYALRDKYNLRSTLNPGAVVIVHVDARGKVMSKKIKSEAPPNGGHGRLLLDVVDEEKFIPAQSNGQPVAGDYELAVDFGHLRNPDKAADVGTLIKRDSY